ARGHFASGWDALARWNTALAGAKERQRQCEQQFACIFTGDVAVRRLNAGSTEYQIGPDRKQNERIETRLQQDRKDDGTDQV
ncbi:MAG: hypothetical protein CBB71_23315, partial [Rhodopirellula sp. TMED11]